ncbi:MAG: methionyl-tRNA formyltransferase [Succinivibrionaceae bacterium]|nr:methionyl-tRNA formyltransferase [Succinivibrionaceae bacterium]
MSGARIIFAGTPPFAAAHLEALLASGIEPVAVYSQPDRPKGRGHRLTPSAVSEVARSHGLVLRTPATLRDEAELGALEALGADLMVVVAYGLILPKRALEACRLGAVNVHGSLLPRWRGAAPIQRALLAGEARTGVTVMRLAEELDAGDMIATRELDISPTDTSGTLLGRLAPLGCEALLAALPGILDGTAPLTPQDPALATYAHKIGKAEAQCDFRETDRQVDLMVRGYSPWPLAQCSVGGLRLKLLAGRPLGGEATAAPGTITALTREGIEVACKAGRYLVVTLQAPGKGPMNAADFARGRQDLIHTGVRFDELQQG